MEPLPDLSTLSDDDLSALLRRRETEEDAISQRRRLLHGRIDILRGERTARLKAQVAAGNVDLPAPTSLVGTSVPLSKPPSPRSVTRRIPLSESGPPRHELP